jgi:SNF2 family DNA or RNA helicase
MTLGVVDIARDRSGLEVVPSGDRRIVEEKLRASRPDVVFRRAGRRLVIGWSCARDLRPDSVSGLEWTPEAARAVLNRSHVNSAADAVLARVGKIRDGGADAARALITHASLAPTLDDHQALNVAVMTVPGGWGACVFDEQGTGKTVTTICAFDVLVERNEADVLIIAAPKSMVGEWEAEFERFTGDLYRISVVDGNRRQRAAAIQSGADVVVTNYEGAVTLLPELRLLAKRCRVVLVIDESFNVKNPDARRTGALAELREWCTRCYVLCGTPAPNAPRDLISQFDLVDFGLAFGGMPINDDPDAEIAEIRDAINVRGIYTRNLKDVVLPDLPERQFTEIRVDLAPVQRQLYVSNLDRLIHDVETVSAPEFARQRTSFLERRNALLRICSFPRPLDPGYDEIPAKFSALDELLPSYADAGEKVVLWSFYRATLDALADRYASLGLVRIDGSVGDVATRRASIRQFQEDKETKLFLGNPAAAGAGITLHSARIAIYESFSNQAAHFMQSLDRIHRRGQERDVEYVVLLCDRTIEETEYQRLLDKADRQADILGDPAPQRPTQSVLLAELLDARIRVAAVPDAAV